MGQIRENTATKEGLSCKQKECINAVHNVSRIYKFPVIVATLAATNLSQ